MGHRDSGRVVLAGDVGGTKTTLAIYDGDEPRSPRTTRTFESRAAGSLDEILGEFLAGAPAPRRACLAVAGPALGRSARITNLPWNISAPALSERFAIDRVALMNDVQALAGVTGTLRAAELVSLQDGREDPEGAVAVLALGTGLGEAFLAGERGARVAGPSEGGHADFAPVTPLQNRLLTTLWKELGHVSVERVCSGSGLPRVYQFLRDTEGVTEDPGIAAEIASAADPAPVIVRAAVAGRSELCREAAALVCEILAAEAGNLALKVLATGGVFLGGGLAPRLLSFLQAPRFRDAFLAKGRFASLLERMPVRVILSPDAVLWGAALRAMEMREAD